MLFIKKLQKANEILIRKQNVNIVYYITSIDSSPKHIKYRYYAKLDNNKNIQTIGLDCVTEIEGDYVSFKEIFTYDVNNKKNYNSDIQSHLDLFLDLISLDAHSLKYTS